MQPILTRAKLCLALGESMGARGKHPSNVYNVLADAIKGLEALEQIADIAAGSTTANSLPHIEKIAREVLE